MRGERLARKEGCLQSARHSCEVILKNGEGDTKVTRQEAHKILDKCLDEAESKVLYGQMAFTMHFVNGKLLQITDQGWKRTWRSPDSTA